MSMATSNTGPVALSTDNLNDWDERILDYLAEGRATPGLVRKMMLRDNVTDDISRQYINERMTRLAEHNHLRNLLDSGVYELTSDPREE